MIFAQLVDADGFKLPAQKNALSSVKPLMSNFHFVRLRESVFVCVLLSVLVLLLSVLHPLKSKPNPLRVFRCYMSPLAVRVVFAVPPALSSPKSLPSYLSLNFITIDVTALPLNAPSSSVLLKLV